MPVKQKRAPFECAAAPLTLRPSPPFQTDVGIHRLVAFDKLTKQKAVAAVGLPHGRSRVSVSLTSPKRS